MNAREMALPFIIITICVLQLLIDTSLLSFVTVLMILATFYTFINKDKKKLYSDFDAGKVSMNSDAYLQTIMKRLQKWRLYDPDLNKQILKGIDNFFTEYGLLLMNKYNDNERIGRFDKLFDIRKSLINNLYSTTFKSADIPIEFTDNIIIPMIDITHKYIKILSKKYHDINKRHKEYLNSSTNQGDFF